MKQFPDPQQHFNESVVRSNEKYAAWLRRGGVEPNEILMRANQDDAINEAADSYIQEATEILDHNTRLILKNSHRRMNQIKRRGANLRLWTCLPIALLLGLVAWYCFSQANIVLGLAYSIGVFAFLGMLVFGAIFDRSR